MLRKAKVESGRLTRVRELTLLLLDYFGVEEDTCVSDCYVENHVEKEEQPVVAHRQRTRGTRRDNL